MFYANTFTLKMENKKMAAKALEVMREALAQIDADRLDHVAAFGSEDYSKEELIAEIGAAALVNHTGIETPDSFRNNAAYVQNWLQVLKDDKRFIVSAAGKAEKAVNMILG